MPCMPLMHGSGQIRRRGVDSACITIRGALDDEDINGAMKISIELEVQPDEVGLCTELLATLRWVDDDCLPPILATH